MNNLKRLSCALGAPLLAAALLAAGAPAALAQTGAQPARPDATPAEPQVLYSSTLWTKASNDIEGTYWIVEKPDGARVLRLGRDFSTRSGPDLKVVLSPIDAGRVKSTTALQGGLVLGLLKPHKGAQEFAIPARADLSKYKSVLIHCEQYTKLWGAAPLSKGEVVAASDDWTRKAKRTSGGYEIVERGGDHYIRFGGGFKTAKAPEPLRVVLSKHTPQDAKSGNAMSEGVVVAKLRSESGAQEFKLPAGTDPNAYRSVLLHCERYTKLWSAAPMKKVTAG